MCTVSALLPPSKSFAKPGSRRYHWLPARPGAFHLGTLTLVQGRRDADSYQLDEEPTGVPGVRRFLLAKLDAEGDVYAVEIGWAGVTCSGVWCGRCATCKHREAVVDLLTRGELGDAPTQPAPECPHCAGFRFVPTDALDGIPCPACCVVSPP